MMMRLDGVVGILFYGAVRCVSLDQRVPELCSHHANLPVKSVSIRWNGYLPIRWNILHVPVDGGDVRVLSFRDLKRDTSLVFLMRSKSLNG